MQKLDPLTESDVKIKLVEKNSFDYFCETPFSYLHKLIKKDDPEQA